MLGVAGGDSAAALWSGWLGARWEALLCPELRHHFVRPLEGTYATNESPPRLATLTHAPHVRLVDEATDRPGATDFTPYRLRFAGRRRT